MQHKGIKQRTVRCVTDNRMFYKKYTKGLENHSAQACVKAVYYPHMALPEMNYICECGKWPYLSKIKNHSNKSWIQMVIWIHPMIKFILPCIVTSYPEWILHQDPLITFWIMLLTDKPTLIKTTSLAEVIIIRFHNKTMKNMAIWLRCREKHEQHWRTETNNIAF